MKKIPFHYTYAKLPEKFFSKVAATAFPDLRLLKWNQELSEELNLDRHQYTDLELAEIFSGKKISDDNLAVAQAYSGHQFAQFNPHLGDGRAFLLGELTDNKGQLRDIHLKGSGQTQYSRRGDGRANLSAVIREYLVSEALHGLSIPSSRSLAVIGTGENVQRETVQPGAILVRVAASHIRIGTFEHFASQNDLDSLKRLADYVIDRHYPDTEKSPTGYIALFRKIAERQVSLISSWMSVGFVHGVMNTDNTFISGETLDFGPCAFMEDYDPNVVFSSIDQNGRYAFIKQPEILQWNLSSLGQCFLMFIDGDKETVKNQLLDEINQFSKAFYKIHLGNMGKKFGLFEPKSDDFALMQSFLKILLAEHSDYTNSFRQLSKYANPEYQTQETNGYSLFLVDDMKVWLQTWRERLKAQNEPIAKIQDLMNSINPAYIARNHRVEEAIRFAVDRNDFSKFEKLNAVLKSPFVEYAEWAEYTNPATPEETITETFCNT
jgi:serine/tyrosine/threonine adenylyltransferase